MRSQATGRAVPLLALLAFLALAACGAEEGAQTSGTPLLSEEGEIDLISVSEAVWAREAALGVEALSSAERVFLHVWNLEAEVNNGGFEQFYYNSSGDYALQTPGALREIGAARVAAIVEEANKLFGPSGPPSDRDARDAALEGLGDDVLDAFGALDDRFYEYPDDLGELLTRFVDRNREQFLQAR